MANIISVSITQEQETFVQDMKLSPSKMLQGCINELMESQRVNQKVVDELKLRIKNFQEVVNKQRDFIESRGLMDEFFKI